MRIKEDYLILPGRHFLIYQSCYDLTKNIVYSYLCMACLFQIETDCSLRIKRIREILMQIILCR